MLNQKLKEQEIWVRVPEIEGRKFSKYEVSSRGRIRKLMSSGRYHVVDFRNRNWNNGYPMVHMRDDNGKPKNHLVHRVVCIAFNGYPINKSDIVMHLDNNKMHPFLENLAWGTLSENAFIAKQQVGSQQYEIEGEIWKTIPLYPIYECSDCFEYDEDGKIVRGQIRNKRGRILASHNHNGYHRVKLFVNKVQKTHFVHWLVCYTYYGPPFDGATVRHLDGNKLNNSPDNLCWGTYREQAFDRNRHGTGRKRLSYLLTSEEVNQIRKACELYCDQYGNGLYARLAEFFKVSRVTIRHICIRKSNLSLEYVDVDLPLKLLGVLEQNRSC